MASPTPIIIMKQDQVNEIIQRQERSNKISIDMLEGQLRGIEIERQLLDLKENACRGKIHKIKYLLDVLEDQKRDYSYERQQEYIEVIGELNEIDAPDPHIDHLIQQMRVLDAGLAEKNKEYERIIATIPRIGYVVAPANHIRN